MMGRVVEFMLEFCALAMIVLVIIGMFAAMGGF